jgi:hypothetical protein
VSGLYNLVLGDGNEGVRGSLVLTLLGVPPEDRVRVVGRFRDAWVERQGDAPPLLVIYTRNGGGNREDLAEAIEAMQAHPLYVRDEDDAFDPTYATFWFRVPEECPSEVFEPWTETREAIVEAAVEPIDMAARWAAVIAQIGGVEEDA